MTEPAPPIVTKEQLIFELGKLGLKVRKIDVWDGTVRLILEAGDLPESPEGWLEPEQRRKAEERARSLAHRLPMCCDLDVYFSPKGGSDVLR
jgi:hypothetical protein